MKSGKAYAHRTGVREGDYYPTPKSLVWVAKDIIKKEFTYDILEPAAGQLNTPIWEVLTNDFGMAVYCNDLHDPDSGNNYLTDKHFFNLFSEVITNPPFTLWDEFVIRAKEHCKKFMFVGRLNYFGTQGRLNSGIWKNLKGVYPFSRYVDYQTPYRNDGCFHVGAMATAWFLWDMDFNKNWSGHVLDVKKYATLGAFRK